MVLKWFIGLGLVVLASANPASSRPEFWKGTALDSTVERMRSSCAEDDTIACFQFKAFSFLDNLIKGDYFQFGNNVEVSRNSYHPNEITSRSVDDNLENGIEEFIKSHDISFKVPAVGKVTVDSRSLDEHKIDLKLNFEEEGQVEARKKSKSKIKKILMPILVFVLLKAITVVPLAIGILGLKAWNGLQLAFFSFIVSVGLAIFQLCQKLAADSAHAHAHISAPGPWDTSAHIAARSLGGQEMAYSAYAPW